MRCRWPRRRCAVCTSGGQHSPRGPFSVSESTSEQAYLPAEQPSPGEDPRLSAAHAHPCRARHPRSSSAQGPQRAVGLSLFPSVLPARARLHRSDEFAAVLRRGRRVGRSTLVVHLLPQATPEPAAGPAGCTPAESGPGVKAGFVVSRSVGGAVVRNRVRRRLQHLVRDRMPGLTGDCLLVVRALPPAAGATYRQLAADLDGALQRLLRSRS